MKSKKDVIFSVRFDGDMSKLIRKIAFDNCISTGSFLRRVVKSYLVSKGLFGGRSK